MLRQRTYTTITPSPFTGKEKDPETGYSYFGARYLDHELMTCWLSVDPMSDKYPSLSPYAYCAWNPVILTDPDGLKPRFMGLLNYLGIAKYGLSRAGEAKTIGNYYILPIYDAENKELIAYNAVRHRSNGDIVTEYQMDPGDLEIFRNNVNYYEMAANLLYCNGEPDWKYVAMTDNIFSGNIGGALSELGKMWKESLQDPFFYYSIAASVLVVGNSFFTDNKVSELAVHMKEWIGKDPKVIINSSKDMIILSKDNKRRIRFDINNTSPHQNPHVHLEYNTNGKWKSERYYPKDVEQK